MASLASEDVILQLRRPTVLYTEQYLDDPIEVTVDQRFVPETVLAQLNVIEVVERDNADFIEITVGTSIPAIYPIMMQSAVYNRDDFVKIINQTFSQLISAQSA